MTDIPDNPQKIQIESVQFRAPVAESPLENIGGGVNYLLKHIFAVGDICHSMQTLAQFQASHSTDWVLADGSAVPGSTYATNIGANVPDLRGLILRGKNNARADGKQNPDGEIALGAYTADRQGAHTHGVSDPGHSHQQDGYQFGASYGSDNTTQNPFVDPTGTPSRVDTVVGTGLTVLNSGTNIGADNAPKTATVNYFIRIN